VYLGDHQELRHHHFRFKFTELNEIYIFNSLRSLAFTFIANFIPIFILLNKGDIKILFYYYIIMYSGEALLGPFVSKLIRHIGPKHTISLCVPFLISHFFFLQTLDIYNWSVWILALSGSFALGLFWQAYHFDFSRAKRKKKATRDVTSQYILLYLMSIMAPFIGGYLMDSGGPFIAFGVAIGLLLLGTLALFKTGDKHDKTDKLDFSRLDYRSVSRDVASYIGLSIEAFVGMTIWQLFVFLIVGDYKSVGLAVSAMLLVSVIIMHTVGKSSDKNAHKKKQYIKVGGLGKGFFGLARIFAVSIVGVYVVNIARAVFGSLIITPWVSEYYLHADEQPRSEYILIMEMFATFSKVILSVFLLVTSLFLELKGVLIVGLIIGALGAIMASIMPLSRCESASCKKNLKIMPKPIKRGANV
jgi:hypothetical protein